MRMYPAYKLSEVLKLPAITFFALLNEGYRVQFAESLLLAHIGDLPHMEKADREKFYKQLEWASMHPSDILKSSAEGSSPSEIKKLLGG